MDGQRASRRLSLYRELQERRVKRLTLHRLMAAAVVTDRLTTAQPT